MLNDFDYSFVVPAFNVEGYIQKTIESMLQQDTRQSYEIVVVNDGSKDLTENKVRHLMEKYDYVYCISQPNSGLMNAWKTGVMNATGQYIVFVDGDDYIDLDLLNKLEYIIKSQRPDIIVYGLKNISDKGVEQIDCSDLAEGLYKKEEITNRILPGIINNGGVNTRSILPSRVLKVFRRELILSVLDKLPDEINMGEDLITTFITFSLANSVYIIKNYYPYNYVRNESSMTVRKDYDFFGKYMKCLSAIEKMWVPGNVPLNLKTQLSNSTLGFAILFLDKLSNWSNSEQKKRATEGLRMMVNSPEFVLACKNSQIAQFSFFRKITVALLQKKYVNLVLWIENKYRRILS